MQETLAVSNDVAAELAGIGDGVLDALRGRLRCTIRLRGNQLTIEGDDSSVAEARAVVDELVDLVEGGHSIGPSTVDAVLGALEESADIRDVFAEVDRAFFYDARRKVSGQFRVALAVGLHQRLSLG